MFCLLTFKPFGLLVDKLPAYINLPLAFLMRSSACAIIVTINDPRKVSFYLCLILFVVGTLYENTALNGLFNKHLPKDIRGTLTGTF